MNYRESKRKSKSKINKITAKNTQLLNKINTILEEVKDQEKIVSTKLEPNDFSNEDFSLPIIIPKNKNINTPPINQPPSIEKNETKKKKAPKKGMRKGKISSSFMTDVGLIKDKKCVSITKEKNEPKQEKDPVMQSIDRQINDILANIDGIDDKASNAKKEDNLFQQGKDIRELINDIDEYKNNVREEFDEIKYLIKLADKSHNLIGRHKAVMTNIFQGAGLRPMGGFQENFEANSKNNKKNIEKVKRGKLNKEYWDRENDVNDNEPYYMNGYYYRRAKKDENDLSGVFNQLKTINKIKDNISHIQDDFLGYHQNLKQKIKEKYQK